jgi:hypothetical protein
MSRNYFILNTFLDGLSYHTHTLLKKNNTLTSTSELQSTPSAFGKDKFNVQDYFFKESNKCEYSTEVGPHQGWEKFPYMTMFSL